MGGGTLMRLDTQLEVCFRLRMTKTVLERQGLAVLIRFEVENFRSIGEPVELSMVAIDEGPDQIQPERMNEQLVRVAGIYGPNAAGKSNVLAALAWLQDAVRKSLTVAEDGAWGKFIPVTPFRFGEYSSKPSVFALDLAIKGIRFEYQLLLDAEGVEYEALYHYPQGRRKKIFVRDGDGTLSLQSGLGALAGTRKLITRTSLALSAMRKFDEPLTASFIEELEYMSFIGAVLPGRPIRPIWKLSVPQELTRIFGEDPIPGGMGGEEFRRDLRRQVLALIKMADLGISDVRVVKREPDLIGDNLGLELIHEVGEERLAFDYFDESQGTQNWLRVITQLVLAIAAGDPIIFDELDASLHPVLSAQLIELYKSPGSNPKGAQLVFTSHDTGLLRHLGRDQVWLARKRENGMTEFGALSDFAGGKVRQPSNLEASYLSGRFGALPDVNDPEVLQELGLIR